MPKSCAARAIFVAAEELVREAIALAGTTDAFNRRARACRDLGEVLKLADRASEAAVALERAIEFYEQKGNLVGAAQVRSLEADPALSRRHKAR